MTGRPFPARGLRLLGCAAAASVGLLVGHADVAAFPHTLQPGETLAQLAVGYYGSARFEAVLAGANGLDSRGASVVPGMRLEVPAPSHHRVVERETWPDLAERFLGDRRRADALAKIDRKSVV